MQNFHKKAFSLIEISVVIVIIGILIAGISQGIDLYQDMRLATARSLTQNSRVARIPDLVSWYETTGENVFSQGTTSFQNIEKVQVNQKINRWKDSNPNSIYKYDATQTTSANQPKIIFDNDTSLPIVRFDGNPRYLALPDGTVPFGNSEYTVIFISKTDNYGTYGVLGSGNYAVTNKSNAFRYSINGQIINYWWDRDLASPTNTSSKNKFQIKSKKTKIEVKTTTESIRIHHFNGLGQVSKDSSQKGFLASLCIIPDDNGLSCLDLVKYIEKNIPVHHLTMVDKKLRIRGEICRNNKFYFSLTPSKTLEFFDFDQVPKPTIEDGVGKITWEATLENKKHIDSTKKHNLLNIMN